MFSIMRDAMVLLHGRTLVSKDFSAFLMRFSFYITFDRALACSARASSRALLVLALLRAEACERLVLLLDSPGMLLEGVLNVVELEQDATEHELVL